ncbi:U-box domain-containing protein 4 [Nymphaea thermarum]|nr:U-box domain-containing protein 4 [Nymphaea thermarum]
MASDDEFTGEDHRRTVVRETVDLAISGEPEMEVRAAREIRRLAKTSARYRRLFAEAGVIETLVRMLASPMDGSKEAALLALLNLAVKDERNKMAIVDAGPLEPIIGFLKSESSNLREYATAALLTLSASTTTKPIIAAYGAIPLLVQMLQSGSQQAKSDALLALCNLSTYPDNLHKILASKPIPPLISMLKTIKKSSKAAEKCSGLLESLSEFEEGRMEIMEEEGGLLTMVELIEDGSFRSRESSVGALLKMCEGDGCGFREAILNEGVIPGLLQMTVLGKPRSQRKARLLLRLLRNSTAECLKEEESYVGCQFSKEEENDKARKMLAEMVQVSMEQSLRHLQLRALVGPPSELHLAN